ncbi:MAG: LOG family protein [Ignavibacteria bacterium]|nr:LOG family protein [Ignavibacteria bacterium]
MQILLGFVVMPGGFGTMDEPFQAVTPMQTKKITHFPVVFIGKDYYQEMMRTTSDTMLK